MSKIPRLRAKQPLPAPARWGAVVGLAAALGAGYVWTSDILFEIDPAKLLWSLAAGTAALLLLLGLAARLRWLALRDGLGLFLLVLFGLAGWYALAAWQTRFLQAIIDLYENAEWISRSISLGRNGEEWLSVASALLTPLLLLIGLVAAGPIRRVPVTIAIVSGFRRIAVPLACVLVFIYCGLALETAHLEAGYRQKQERILKQPATYYAAVFGQPWPGPVP